MHIEKYLLESTNLLLVQSLYFVIILTTKRWFGKIWLIQPNFLVNFNKFQVFISFLSKSLVKPIKYLVKLTKQFCLM